jgi:hypothetical protein
MDASAANRPKRGPDFLSAMPPIAKRSVYFIVVVASWFAAHAETSPSVAASPPMIAFMCDLLAWPA